MGRMGIPLCDNSFGECHPHCYVHIAGRIKIQYWRLHTNCAAEPNFEICIGEVLHKSGQVSGSAEGRPFDGLAMVARNPCKRPPLVNRQVRGSVLFVREEPASEAEGQQPEHQQARAPRSDFSSREKLLYLRIHFLNPPAVALVSSSEIV